MNSQTDCLCIKYRPIDTNPFHGIAFRVIDFDNTPGTPAHTAGHGFFQGYLAMYLVLAGQSFDSSQHRVWTAAENFYPLRWNLGE